MIAAIPNYVMCSLKLPLGFLDHVEGTARGFLWRSKDIEKKGNCLVKWEKVCKPKKGRWPRCTQHENSEYSFVNEESLQIHEQARHSLGSAHMASTLYPR
jgi:hypothetical protein